MSRVEKNSQQTPKSSLCDTEGFGTSNVLSETAWHGLRHSPARKTGGHQPCTEKGALART